MEVKVLLLFLWSCSVPVQSVIRRYLWYHGYPHKWTKAQELCRSEDRKDLATLVSAADLEDVEMKVFHAWIGIRKIDGQWKWVTNQKDVALTIANEVAGDECGKVKYSQAKAFADVCGHKRFVLCEDYSHGKHFIPESMSWEDGRLFCESQRMYYMDYSGSSLHYDDSPVYQQQDFPVWIGLYGQGNDWVWSDGTHSDYRTWTSVPSDTPGPSPDPGSCVAISSKSRTMVNKSCDEVYPYICYRHNVVLLKEEVDWEDAMETCMNLTNAYDHSFFNLLSFEESEPKYAQSFAKGATTSKVWVGLRFLAGSWVWTDGSPVSLTLPPCAVGLCGALVVNSTSASDPVVEATDCSEKLNLLCCGSDPQWTEE